MLMPSDTVRKASGIPSRLWRPWGKTPVCSSIRQLDAERYPELVNAEFSINADADQVPDNQPITSALKHVDGDSTDSDYESDSMKSPVRKPNLSKPKASRPSASQIASQKKRSGIPKTSVPSSVRTYTRSDSPVYSEQHTDNDGNLSESSSGSSCSFHPDLSDGESTDTFEGFDHDDLKPSPKKGTGKLNMVYFGLRRRKRVWTYRCQTENCKYIGKSLRELNVHHIYNHDKVQCNGCEKVFNTPSSMKRHSYCHGDLPHVCDVCKEGFAFKSELSFHRTVHRTVSSFPCVSKGCGKSFKLSNELNKHTQKHLGVTWDCGKCDYLTDN